MIRHGERRDYGDFAVEELAFNQIGNRRSVVGVTGGSGEAQRAGRTIECSFRDMRHVTRIARHDPALDSTYAVIAEIQKSNSMVPPPSRQGIVRAFVRGSQMWPPASFLE